MEYAPFVLGMPGVDVDFALIGRAGCGGLSEPSGPSDSACVLSAAVSTIAIGLVCNFVSVLVYGGCNVGMCGIGFAVFDDADVLRCLRDAEGVERCL